MNTKRAPITMEQVLMAVEQDDNLGICLACGAEQGNCEPDARRYKCEACGERKVYGAEQIMIMMGMDGSI